MVYSVHMPRSSASEARRNFFALLDAAERGEDVVLERHGVRFRLVREDGLPQALPDSPLIVADPSLLEQDWTWAPDASGDLQFKT